MKIIKLTLTFCLLISLSTCNDAEETKTPTKVQKETHATPLFVELLIGQWQTESNEGMITKWLEFDSSTTTFYEWANEENRPKNASGNFNLIGDSIIDLLYIEFNKHHQYKINSIQNNTLDIVPKDSTGHLIYKKTEYLKKEIQKTETDTLPVVGILKSVNNSDFWDRVYLTVVDENTKTHHFDFYGFDNGNFHTLTKYNGKKVMVNFEIEETLEEQYLHINDQTTLDKTKNKEKTQANVKSSIVGTLIIHEEDKTGDLPSNYRIVDNKGDTTTISAFIYDDHIALNGKNATVYFHKKRTYIATSVIPFEKEKSNDTFIGKWRKEDSSNPIDPTSIEIKKENDSSYALKFSNEDYYISSENTSNILKGNNMSGKFIIEVIPENPVVISYSDNGRDGHFEPNRNIRFVKVK